MGGDTTRSRIQDESSSNSQRLVNERTNMHTHFELRWTAKGVATTLMCNISAMWVSACAMFLIFEHQVQDCRFEYILLGRLCDGVKTPSPKQPTCTHFSWCTSYIHAYALFCCITALVPFHRLCNLRHSHHTCPIPASCLLHQSLRSASIPTAPFHLIGCNSHFPCSFVPS